MSWSWFFIGINSDWVLTSLISFDIIALRKTKGVNYMNEYLTTKDLCSIYKVTQVTIYNWRKEGMPFITLNGRGIRFEKEPVDEWIRGNK